MPLARSLLGRTPRLAGTVALLAGLAVAVPTSPARAASSGACEGGGFRVLGQSGSTSATVTPTTERFTVRGTYVQFDVVASTFEVTDYAFLPTANDEDMTGGVVTPVWQSKEPRHGGRLRSAVAVEINGDSMNLRRTGTLASGASLEMKIQAKDCASGGIFQMEIGRGDGAETTFVHRLATTGTATQPFYFDNQNFRDRIGEWLTADADGDTATCEPGSSVYCVQVSARTTIGNDRSPAFVARDSPQGGAAPDGITRIAHAECGSPQVPGIDHCGGISVWSVASGGRMGFVSGEDAVEVANPPTLCLSDCQAQNRVRGRLAVLDFPFPVDSSDRLQARLCTTAATTCPTRV